MQISHHVEELQRQLLTAAAAGGPEAQDLADRLTAALESAARLVLFEVLSEAAGEITRDLAPGSVDLRLRGREIEFVVSAAAPESDADDRPSASVDLDEASTSRTTLRLPDGLKTQVDQAAAADGVSVNTWLVRAIAAGLEPKQRRQAQRTLRTGDSFAGWAR